MVILPFDWDVMSATRGGAPGFDRSFARPAWDTDLMRDKITLTEKFAELPDAYQPAIIGYMNDYKLVVVKTQGEFVWHKHDETDELFLIVKGRLTIQFRDRDVVLDAGDLFVVPRGVEHCPKADEETHVLLIEPRETVNTGDAGGDRTVDPIEI